MPFAIKKRKHGECIGRRNCQSPEFVAWCNMRSRCENRKRKDWPNYGGRGITVCDAWQDFAVFLADMGRRPSGQHSLDRRDNDLGYSPANCRWVVRTVQARNKRPYKNGRRYQGRTVPEWAAVWGVAYTTAWYRVDVALKREGNSNTEP